MRAKVVLLARVNAGGKFPFIPVPQARGRFIPVEGATSYYLRYSKDGKRRVEPVGKVLDEAVIALKRQEVALHAARNGVVLKDFHASNRRTIQDAAEEFFQKLESRGMWKTRRTYEKAVRDFQASSTKLFLDEIDQRTILGFIDWMRANLEKRSVGEQATTIRNRLRYLTVFLRDAGVGNPLPVKHWPKVTKRNPDRYSLETVNKMLAVADNDESDLILFFLYTGFRDEEAAFSKFSDVNWRAGSINVSDKPEYGWTVKDREQRPIDIPLPPNFIKRLEARRQRSSKDCELIFPNGNCRPDMHLIRFIQRVSKRAGIQERVTLHRFRRTFGTLYAKQFGLQTARQLLGHSDIKTTALYLAAEELDTPEAKTAVTEMFASVAPSGKRKSRKASAKRR